jgi:isochorismate pyruvate lyase
VKLEKKPSECDGIEECRQQIDEIDREIIRLFALRSDYVHDIVRFKTDEASVIAQNRKNKVIKQRSEWAEAAGLDKKTFEYIYQSLLQQNISEELTLLKQQNKNQKHHVQERH